MFDFEVKHVSKNRHTAADRFSKWSKVEKEKNNIEDFDKFIDSELNVVKILVLKAEKKVDILKSEYLCENQQIMYFLSIMKKLNNVSISDYFKFRKKAVRFLVQKNHLFCCQRKNVLLVRIIDCKN